MPDKCWEDFEIGDILKTPAITITETHVVNWGCLTGDWYPLHFDEEYAKNTMFKGRIAHGPLTFGMAVGLMAVAGVYGDSIMAWLGVDKLRIPAPVRIGDTIHVEAEIIGKKETKQPERGITVLRYLVKNQRSETVMDFEFTLMMHRRQS